MDRIALALIALLCATSAQAAGVFDERKEQCLACHGATGASPTAETPSLGGQPELFILYKHVGIRDGQRKNEIMSEMRKGMTDDDIRAAAALIAKQSPPPKPAEAPDAEKMKRGETLAKANRCDICHAGYAGQEQMPRLKNQREDYLLKALQDYKHDRRFGGRAEMNEVVRPLADNDLADLAHYIAHLP